MDTKKMDDMEWNGSKKKQNENKADYNHSHAWILMSDCIYRNSCTANFHSSSFVTAFIPSFHDQDCAAVEQYGPSEDRAPVYRESHRD